MKSVAFFMLCAILFSSIAVNGQVSVYIGFNIKGKKNQNERVNDTWSQGEITFKDSTKFSGPVNYDFKESLGLFQQNGESLTFHDSDFLTMTFYDSALNKQREINSLSFENNLLSFEVVAAFKKFRVLNHKFPAAYQSGFTGRRTTEEQMEYVVILDESGKIIPYLTKTFNKKFIKEYFSDDAYKAMWRYSSSHDLRFDVKEHFIRILEANRKYIDP